MKRYLKLPKKSFGFRGFQKLYPSGTWKKDEILQVKLHYFQCATINIQIVKKNKKQFQCLLQYVFNLILMHVYIHIIYILKLQLQTAHYSKGKSKSSYR